MNVAAPITYLQPGTRAEYADKVREGLYDTFGSDSEAIVRAPGRLSLMGEHTEWNGGLAIGTALPHCLYAAFARRDDKRVRVASAQLKAQIDSDLAGLQNSAEGDWDSYIGNVVHVLRAAGHEVPGFDMYIDSSLPVGVGLGSSAALSVATVLGLASLIQLKLTPENRDALLAAVLRAETKVDGASIGALDETITFYAHPGMALYMDFRSRERKQVPATFPGHTLLVTHTQVKRKMNTGGWAERRKECIQAAFGMGVPLLRDITEEQIAVLQDETLQRRVRYLQGENARVKAFATAVQKNQWADIRALYQESETSLRDDFEVTDRQLDFAISNALDNGAIGARITGGGFGGSIVSVVPDRQVRNVAEALSVAFAVAQWGNPEHLIATPSGAAAVL